MFSRFFSKYSIYLTKQPFLTKTLTTSNIKSCHSNNRRYSRLVIHREKKSKLNFFKKNIKIISLGFWCYGTEYVWMVSCYVSLYV